MQEQLATLSITPSFTHPWSEWHALQNGKYRQGQNLHSYILYNSIDTIDYVHGIGNYHTSCITGSGQSVLRHATTKP